MKTILATAYAINPLKGSEDAMGWNFVLQIARFNKVIAVTRENNREHIEKYMAENQNECFSRMEFLYFDLPPYQRFWKKGSRGAMLYYILWQRRVVSFLKKQKVQYDIVHNVNFHNDWTPSHLWKLNKPFVWGPVGHHPLIPSFYLKNYSKKIWIKDRLTWLVKKTFWNFSFPLKKAFRKADHVWAMNSSVAKNINVKKENLSVSPSVASEDFCPDWKYQPKEKFTVLSTGRFVALKGFDLSMDAFGLFCTKLTPQQLEKCEMLCIGTGPEELFLKNRAKKLKHGENIEFVNWMPRHDLMNLYQKSSVFLFPSHEGAGMVVPEAMSFGVPVVCLDNCGPGEFVDSESGFVVPMKSYNQTVNDLADSLLKLFLDENLQEKLSLGARENFVNNFFWDRRGEKLKYIYHKLTH